MPSSSGSASSGDDDVDVRRKPSASVDRDDGQNGGGDDKLDNISDPRDTDVLCGRGGAALRRTLLSTFVLYFVVRSTTCCWRTFLCFVHPAMEFTQQFLSYTTLSPLLSFRTSFFFYYSFLFVVLSHQYLFSCLSIQILETKRKLHNFGCSQTSLLYLGNVLFSCWRLLTFLFVNSINFCFGGSLRLSLHAGTDDS